MSKTTAPAPTPRRRRRWRRLLWWLLGLLVLLRLTIWVALPLVLDKVLRDLGFAARWERLDLSLLGGAVELWQLRLAEPGADGAPGAEHLALEYLVADLDVLALLQGQVRVRRAEVDGLRATLREDADGVLHLGPLALGGGGAPVAEPEPAPPADPQQPLDLTPPLHVIAARLQHIAVTLIDRNGRPQEVRLTARVSDLGDPTQAARLNVAITAPGALAALRIDGTGFARGASAELDLTLALDGLRPRQLTPWLARAGLAPASEEIDAGFRLRGRLAPSDADGRIAAGEVLLEGLRVAADRTEAVALDRLRVALPVVSRTTLDLRVEASGLRGLAEQRPDGALRLAGLDLLPGDAAAPPPPPPPPDEPAGSGPELALAADLREVAFTLRDGRVSPPRDLTVRLDELRLPPPPRPRDPQAVLLRLAIPGVAEQIRLEGSVRPFGRAPSADLALSAGPFDGELLADLLRPAGLRPTFDAGSLACQIVADAAPQPDGTTQLHAIVRDLVVRDDAELLRWPLVEVRATTGEALVVDQITMVGPEVQATIDADGRLGFLGLVVLAAEGAAAVAPVPPPPPAPAGGAGLRVRAVSWNGCVLRLRDESVTPPVDLTIGPIEFSAENLDLTPGAAPGVVQLRTPIDGVCREFAVTTNLGPGAGPGSLTADLRGHAHGLTPQPLAPWLARAGLANELADGAFEFAFAGDVTPTAEGARVDLTVRQFALRDGDREHFGLDELRVRDAVFGAGLSVAEVTLQRPRADLARDADGALHFAGLRTLPPAVAAPGTPAPVAPAPAAPRPAGGFALGRATIQDLALVFRDAAGTAPREWTASLGASVENLRPGGEDPARVTLRADVPGLLRGAELHAQMDLGAEAQGVQGSLQVAAIDQQGLAALLPPGTTADVPATAFRADFALGVALHPDGGQRADLSLGPLELRAADGRDLLSLDVARLTVERHDPAAGVLHIGAVRTGGLTLTAERHADGALSALGLRLPPPPPAAAATPTAGADGPPTAPPLAGFRDVVVDAIEIARIELHLRDAAQPTAEPLVASLGLASAEPLRLLGPEPDLLPPVRLQLTGAVLPLCRDIAATLEARPFAPEPSLDLALGIEGIDGEGLRRAFPSLAERIRSDGLAEGSLGAKFHVHAQPRQATQGPFDWSREFALEAELTDLHFRAAADGPVLAGVDAVRLTAPRITPATGAVHVTSLEVTRPRLHARQSAAGLHVMGLLLPPAPAAAAEPAAQATLTAEPDAGALPADAPATAARPAAGEVRIDAILVQGIDLHWRDDTVTPPLEVPFDMLDAEITGFTTRAFTEPETILFRASMGLGKVALPKRYRSGLLGSLVNAAGQAAGIERTTETVQRPLLEELAIRGKLAFAPSLRWELTADISTFELTGLRGVANQGGVAIGDGTVDATLDLAYAVGPGLQTDAEIVFRDLSLSEPAGGPISRYLRLPAPLDTVLFVLRNDQNEQRIPLRFRVGQQGMSTDRIVGMAVATLSTLITKAIATSPLRVLGGITDFAGLTGGVAATAAERARTVTFAPGSITPPMAATAALQDLVAEAQDGALLVLQHELGGADVKIARQLATPPTADTLALLADLRHRRDQLLQQRERELRELRVQIGIEGFDHPRLREGMRTIDRELGRIEQALDEALELLRPDAARRADARARRAALAAAERRLEALRDQLVRAGAPPDRIELRRPRFLAADCDCGSTITVTPRIRSAR